jgi:beta-glucosidase
VRYLRATLRPRSCDPDNPHSASPRPTDGSAAGGLNGAPFTLNNRSFHEHFLKPWRGLVAVGLRGAMPSHNTVLDTPMHANRWAIRGVLRGEFGGGNLSTVSDCNDIGALAYFHIAPDHAHVVGLALRAGLDSDLQCGPGPWSYDGTSVGDAIAAGAASAADVDELVTHVLTQKFAAGLFDSPQTPAAWTARLNSPAHQQLAYEAAAQGAVLLKNDGGLLPLSTGARKVALLGPHMQCNADGTAAPCPTRDAYLGSYTLDDGSVTVDLLPAALAAAAPAWAQSVAPGCAIDGDPRLDLVPAAVAAAAAADVSILALGDSLASCGEWQDRDSLDLPGGQMALLAAVAALGKPLVVVLINGRAASFGPANAVLNNITALVEAWRPGQEGARALADIIIGAVNPSGKLASQWAQNVGQLGSGAQPWVARRVAKWLANNRSPADPTDGRVYDPYVASAFPSTPLFRFGSGLSYTSFNYTSLGLSPAPAVASLPGGGTFSGRGRAGYVDAISTAVVTASVTVCNTGARAGTEVVQVYVQDPIAGFGFETPIVPMWKRLVGFARVPLEAGACDTAAVPILADDLAVYDDLMQLRVVPGAYVVTAGGRSDTDFLSAPLVLA